MKIYRLAEQSYTTKDGRPITFVVHPFAEKSDDRGWVYHHIDAYVGGEKAGYIKLSYISKENWEKIFKTPWDFAEHCLGKRWLPKPYDDEQAMQEALNKQYVSSYNLQSMKPDIIKEMRSWYLYYVDKPIVDFVSTSDKFRRQHIADALHKYAARWLHDTFGLKLFYSTCLTPGPNGGQAYYSKSTLPRKKFHYNEKMNKWLAGDRTYLPVE